MRFSVISKHDDNTLKTIRVKNNIVTLAPVRKINISDLPRLDVIWPKSDANNKHLLFGNTIYQIAS